MEFEDIIQGIIEEEDEVIKQEQTQKDQEEIKRMRKDKFIKRSQKVLGIIIVLFLVMTLFSWFKLGGRATSEGFVRIPNNIISKEYKNLEIKDKLEYNGVYVKMSPFELIHYTGKYFSNYKRVYNQNGNEKISVFSFLHMIFIYAYVLVIILSVLSALILFLQKGRKFSWFLKYAAGINLIIFIGNFLILKIPSLNMYTLRALSQFRKMDLIHTIEMTQKGIVVNNGFYQYMLTVTMPFILALVLLIVWFVMAMILSRCVKAEKEISIKSDIIV